MSLFKKHFKWKLFFIKLAFSLVKIVGSKLKHKKIRVRRLIKPGTNSKSEQREERIAWNLSFLVKKKEFDVTEGWARYQSAKKYRGQLLYQIRWLKAAVILAFVLISGLVLYNLPENEKAIPGVKMVETIVPLGSKTKIILPDGTSVWLNAGSRFSYPARFHGKERVVLLEGEAYFDVVTMPRKPFHVKTGDVTVKALGTTFNVKAYADDGITETTLIEGELVISKAGNETEIRLKPNEKITIIGNTSKHDIKEILQYTMKDADELQEETIKKIQSKKIILEKQVDPKPVYSWKDSNWIISGETLASLAVKLERRYDVTIDFKSEDLKRMKFSGTLRDESVEQVLTYMSRVSDLKYAIDGKQVAFYKDSK